MNLIVIHEQALDDMLHMVIGVADSVENAQKIIDEYYGEHEELFFHDIRDSNIEWQKKLLVEALNGEYTEVSVWLEWFTLNSIN